MVASLVGLALTACSSDKPNPTPLQSYTPTIHAHEVWHGDIGSVGFPLVASLRGDTVYLASDAGAVVALKVDGGESVWRASAGAKIAAGVGSDGRYASVVTVGNEVVTFDRGREVWRRRIDSAVVTPPLVAGARVFVMGVDRAVHAFDAADGAWLWDFQRPGEALTLAQAGVIAPFHNTLLVGQGPQLAAIEPLHGTLEWEVALATPRGTNEVERLADLVGPIVRAGNRVCARAFQSAVACADASTGALLWSRNAGGIEAVGGNAEAIFGGDASDRITAWRTATGDVLWTNETLLYRGLSGAAVFGGSVVFGDSEGWVHFLSAADGALQLRLPTDGKPVVGKPVVGDSTLVVTTSDGGVYAFRRN
jgi:outer membrane protein assembly factor BamB